MPSPQELLKKEGIHISGWLSLAGVRLHLPRLLASAGFGEASAEQLCALLFAVPYLAPLPAGQCANLSAYARAKDYHLYFRKLFDRILPVLQAENPGYRFAGFADHSPLFEVEAACRAGLGVLGESGLLITKEYSSYVFIGEIITDLPVSGTPQEIRPCRGCGNCRRACPMRTAGGICRSALTQKKGELTPEETGMLGAHPLVWGCDTCSAVCPHTKDALEAGTIYSPLPFFREDLLPQLTGGILAGMPEGDFARRAYAWRGRDVIRRNIRLKEENEQQ